MPYNVISFYWKSFPMNRGFVVIQCVSLLFLASPEDEAIKLQRRTSYLMATAKDRDSHKLSLDKTHSPSQSQTEIHLQWVPFWNHLIMKWKSNRHCHILYIQGFFLHVAKFAKIEKNVKHFLFASVILSNFKSWLLANNTR